MKPLALTPNGRASAAAGRAPVLPDGLVQEVTTRTAIRGPSRWAILKDLNKQRRIRRMQSVIRSAAEASQNVRGFRTDCVMVTLTYRDGVQWESGHVAAFLDTAKHWLSRRRIERRYQWVLELTQRGRVHYHVLFWLPPGAKLPKPDEAGWWRHGMTRIERARRAVGYICKYASKGCGDSDQIPKGARLFGVGLSGSSEETRAERVGNHRAGLPRWLREVTAGRCSREPRLGWRDRITGDVYKSPFRLRFERDDCRVWTVIIEATNGVMA